MTKSVIIIIDYFGRWPEWMPLFLLSCRSNPTIQWLFHTDAPRPDKSPPNVRYVSMRLSEYREKLRRRLGIQVSELSPYKICDYRPAFGKLHSEEIAGYDYFGYGDLDVIYGNIRRFYDDRVLSNDIISSHEWCLSGHLTLIRNTEALTGAYQQVPGWKDALSSPHSLRFDEDAFSSLFIARSRWKLWCARHTRAILPKDTFFGAKMYLKEQYTTPLTPTPWRDGRRRHPRVWFWKDGVVSNDYDWGEQFIYLHFMNFKTARYFDFEYGDAAPWTKLAKILTAEVELYEGGFRIDFEGIHPLHEAGEAWSSDGNSTRQKVV